MNRVFIVFGLCVVCLNSYVQSSDLFDRRIADEGGGDGDKQGRFNF